MTKTCLIVSPYFPPSTLAGVHRARLLARHLPAAGWRPIIACVDEAYHEERLDPALAALSPPELEIVKTRALSPRLARRFGIGDISLRAWRPLRRAVFDLLKTRTVDAVLITGSPYYPMLMAPQIKRRFNTPVVLDFQDPWVSNWGATLSRFSKGGAAHRLAMMLEPRALRGADFVTSVSETQNEQMRARHPWLSPDRMAAIPIGGDPADYEALRAQDGGDPHGFFPQGQITLSYVGTFMPRTEPLLRVFFKGFARARNADPEGFGRVRLLFVGTSNQPNDTTSFRVRAIAAEYGLDACMRELPQRLPYLEAITVLSRSDGILLIGSDEPHYTASKIYPGLMAGRPWLSIFHEASSAHQILQASGGGVALSFGDSEALAALEPAVAGALERIVARSDSLGEADPEAFAPYTAREIARRFAEIFDHIAVQPGPSA